MPDVSGDEARAAIEALIFEYARRVDAGDFDGVGALFSGATYRAEVGGEVAEFSGADAVTGVMAATTIRHEDGTPSTQHVVSNVVVSVDGETATAASMFTVFQARPGFPLQPIVAGRYEDRFVLDAALGWRFADRLVRTDLVGDVRHHLRVNPFS